MFRSLFIGFLILSTLVSKGAGVQIEQNTAISAEMLLNLYNAAVAYADSQAGISNAQNEGALTGTAKGTAALAIQELIRSARHDGEVFWMLPDDHDGFSSENGSSSGWFAGQSTYGEIYSTGSDISPPYGVKCA